MSRFSLVEFMAFAGVVTLIAAVLFATCDRQADTQAPLRALETMGFRNARIVDSAFIGAWNGCGEHEVSYSARAENPAGQQVDVVVCCGVVMKACTVRSR